MQWRHTAIVGAILLLLLQFSCSVDPGPDFGEPDVGYDADVDVGSDDVFAPPDDVPDTGPTPQEDAGFSDTDPDLPDDEGYRPGEAPYGSQQVQIGSWDDDGFVQLRQGDVLRWEEGRQAGFHVWGAFRAEGSAYLDMSHGELNDVSHTYELVTEDGEIIAGVHLRGLVYPYTSGVEAGGFTLMLQRPREPQDYVQGPYRLSVRVEFPDRQVHESHVWVYLECCDRL